MNGNVVINSGGKRITVSTSKKSNVIPATTITSAEVKTVVTTLTATTNTKSATVYITKAGKKYHKDG